MAGKYSLLFNKFVDICLLDEKIMEYLCYHSHNNYCDGSNSLEEYIQSAINQGVIHYGFSSHSPLFFENKWSIKEENLLNYSNEIDLLTQKYSKSIKIFKSLEIDFVPGFSNPSSYFQDLLKLDYQIGSVHLVVNPNNNLIWFIDGPREPYKKGVDKIFDGCFKAAVQQYYLQVQQMIIQTNPTIVGHLDKVVMNNQEEYFSVEEQWYQKAVSQTLKTILKNKTIVEVNTRGIYRKKWNETFPSTTILNQCFRENIPIVISSDAHHPSEVINEYENTRELLMKIGYRYQMKKHNNSWIKSLL